MRWPIRYQLLLPWLTLLLGVVGITTWNAISAARRVREQLEERVRNTIRSLSRLPENYPLYDDKILELAQGLSGAEILVVDQEGQRHSTLSSAPAKLTPTELAAIQLPETHVEPEAWQSLRLDQDVKAGRQKYLCGGVRTTRGRSTYLYVFYPQSLWSDAEWEAVTPSLILGGFAGVASLVLAVAVGAHMGQRIAQVEKRTRQIAGGDFTPMPLPGRNDELRDLGRAVNEMAQRLAGLQDTVQKTERLRLLGQVSGGLAHQLRNSAAGARLAVQLYLREHPGEPTDTEPLEVALRQLVLLESNLKRFLDLGRAGELRRERLSIVSLLDDSVTLLAPQCRHTHVDLRWRRPEGDLLVLGDRGQLGQVLINLLDNAISAAGPGGWVEAAIHKVNSTCVTEVRDSGAGPPETIVSRLFEPFATSKPEGVGLGLAVARQIAQAHGGDVSWKRNGKCTVFRLSIPLAIRNDSERG
jgi:signal transduction histidine kinase